MADTPGKGLRKTDGKDKSEHQFRAEKRYREDEAATTVAKFETSHEPVAKQKKAATSKGAVKVRSTLVRTLKKRLQSRKSKKSNAIYLNLLDFLEEDSFSNLSLRDDALETSLSEDSVNNNEEKSSLLALRSLGTAAGSTAMSNSSRTPQKTVVSPRVKKAIEMSTQTTPSLERVKATSEADKDLVSGKENRAPKLPVPFVVTTINNPRSDVATPVQPGEVCSYRKEGSNSHRSFQSLAKSSSGFAPQVKIPAVPRVKKLRPVVIDGSNVAMGHGRNVFFSWKGIQLCVDYFVRRGHDVKVFVPEHRRWNLSWREQETVSHLESRGYLIFTPSTYIRSRRVTPYDDRYIVDYAKQCGGVIVSRDRYRDLLDESYAWQQTIENRLLIFTFVGDNTVMFPNDPLGRYGPTLDEFLQFPY